MNHIEGKGLDCIKPSERPIRHSQEGKIYRRIGNAMGNSNWIGNLYIGTSGNEIVSLHTGIRIEYRQDKFVIHKKPFTLTPES